jgi:hypothetical protein
MNRLELKYDSKSIFSDVLAARDRRENFCLVVNGSTAKKLHRIIPFYRRYRESLSSLENKRGALFAFGIRALRNPLFWGLCVLCESHARGLEFVFSGSDELRVNFNF